MLNLLYVGDHLGFPTDTNNYVRGYQMIIYVQIGLNQIDSWEFELGSYVKTIHCNRGLSHDYSHTI